MMRDSSRDSGFGASGGLPAASRGTGEIAVCAIDCLRNDIQRAAAVGVRTDTDYGRNCSITGRPRQPGIALGWATCQGCECGVATRPGVVVDEFDASCASKARRIAKSLRTHRKWDPLSAATSLCIYDVSTLRRTVHDH